MRCVGSSLRGSLLQPGTAGRCLWQPRRCPLLPCPGVLSSPRRSVAFSFSGETAAVADAANALLPGEATATASTALFQGTDLIRHRAARHALREAAQYPKMSEAAFLRICDRHGIGEQEAKLLLQAWHESGMLLHWKTAQIVFGQPDVISHQVIRLLGVDDTHTRRQLEHEQSRLATLTRNNASLQSSFDILNAKARRFADRVIWAGFGFIGLQYAAMVRLTYWELSWDVMEPVTWTWSFAYTLAGIAFFASTRTEFTYDGIRSLIQRRRLERLLTKHGFDQETFRRNTADIEASRDRMRTLETRLEEGADLSGDQRATTAGSAKETPTAPVDQ